MINQSSPQYSHQDEFDQWKSIIAGLFLSVIGYSVLVGLPVISSAWSDLLGFTDPQVGRVAGADQGGLAIGAVLTAFIIARANRRHLLVVATIIVLISNGLCMVVTDYLPVLWLRLIAGFGSGIYTAVAVSTLGATSRPARAFNMMLFLFAFTQAAELFFLPFLSMNGVYWVFITIYVLSIPLFLWVPSWPASDETNKKIQAAKAANKDGASKIPAYVPWLCLTAIATTYINIGAYWAYIELASEGTNATPGFVGQVLVWASFLSIAGCLFATLVSNRFGLARPLIVTLIIHASVVGMLALGITNTTFLMSVFMFNFLWIFVDVYQMSTVANVDPTGKFASLMPGAQGLGYIIGPVGASILLEKQLGYDAVFIMCACASLTAMVIYTLMYVKLRKIIPALADAS